MRQKFTLTNSGAYAPGLSVIWQRGPLLTDEDRQEANGCLVETLIDVALDRLRRFQDGPLACGENAMAIAYLRKALSWLDDRTEDRQARGVEGTNNV